MLSWDTPCLLQAEINGCHVQDTWIAALEPSRARGATAAQTEAISCAAVRRAVHQYQTGLNPQFLECKA